MAELYYWASAEGTNAWTNPSNARGTSADTTYATAAPGNNAIVNGIWKTYGFSLAAGDTVTKVEVIPLWKTSTTDSIATLRIDVSWNNGINWSTVQTDTTEPTSDTDTTFDVTSATTWNSSTLSDANFLVRVGAQRGNSNTAVTFSLDRIPVRVTYTPAAVPATRFSFVFVG